MSATAKTKRFREAIPIGFASADTRAALHDGLSRRLDELRATVDLENVLDSFLHRIKASRPAPRGEFDVAVRVIGPTTILRCPHKTRYELVAEATRTILTFDGRRLVLPPAVRSTLEAMAARVSFTLHDLPNQLDEHAKLAFVRLLESEGFLVQV